jgi:transposase-like protein
LEVLSRAEHARLHVREPEIQRFVCPECSNTFDKLMRYHRKNQMKKGAAGPFCGRRCSGRYNQRKRN